MSSKKTWFRGTSVRGASVKSKKTKDDLDKLEQQLAEIIQINNKHKETGQILNDQISQAKEELQRIEYRKNQPIVLPPDNEEQIRVIKNLTEEIKIQKQQISINETELATLKHLAESSTSKTNDLSIKLQEKDTLITTIQNEIKELTKQKLLKEKEIISLKDGSTQISQINFMTAEVVKLQEMSRVAVEKQRKNTELQEEMAKNLETIKTTIKKEFAESYEEFKPQKPESNESGIEKQRAISTTLPAQIDTPERLINLEYVLNAAREKQKEFYNKEKSRIILEIQKIEYDFREIDYKLKEKQKEISLADQKAQQEKQKKKVKPELRPILESQIEQLMDTENNQTSVQIYGNKTQSSAAKGRFIISDDREIFKSLKGDPTAHTIKRVTFYYNEIKILGILAEYEKDKKFLLGKTEMKQFKVKPKERTLEIEKNDYIVSFEGVYRESIEFIKIKTKKAKFFEVGYETPYVKNEKFYFDLSDNAQPITFIAVYNQNTDTTNQDWSLACLGLEILKVESQQDKMN